MHSSPFTQLPVVWNSLQGNSREENVKEPERLQRPAGNCGSAHRKDIVHVGTVVGPGAEARDVELAQLLLLGQLHVVAEVAVVPLVVEMEKLIFQLLTEQNFCNKDLTSFCFDTPASAHKASCFYGTSNPPHSQITIINQMLLF